MYIPLQNKNGEIKGVYCAYLPFGTLEINKFSKTLLFTLIIVSPFIIFFLYTILFIALFYSDIKDNFDTFAHWIDEIKNKNLDFEMEDLGNNEFGELARIFDDMRLELKKSTERNWIMKEERNVMVASLAHDIKTPYQ
ncbi:HAMP domain-containing protein [Hathewaya histolytica]|uniref:HAMP domain-containing protein n=1 Tax=Hathewaya histolytica TaxID=1498 RepID=UPI003B6848BD